LLWLLHWLWLTKFVYEAQRNLLTKTKTKAHNFGRNGLGILWSVRVNFSNQANAEHSVPQAGPGTAVGVGVRVGVGVGSGVGVGVGRL